MFITKFVYRRSWKSNINNIKLYLKDSIYFDGKKVVIESKKVVLMLNKPKKVITTVKDTHGRKTVMDFVPSKLRLTPVGRLDQNTTGLLLLTNDGDLQQYLTHPKNKVPKDYEVLIEGKINMKNIQKLKSGIYIGYKEYGKGEVLEQKTIKGRSKIIFRMKQGKKREIRRIFHRLNKKLISLKRIGYASVKLGNLSEGECRQLTKKEINDLYQI